MLMVFLRDATEGDLRDRYGYDKIVTWLDMDVDVIESKETRT